MTPERIEQERLAFEAWMADLYPTNPQTERVGDEYSRLGTQYKWEGWQAKAAQSEWISVEDRLPEYKNDMEQFLIMCQWKREPKTYFYKTSRLLKMLDHIYFDSEPCGADVIYWQPIPRVAELEANHERD